MAQRLLLMTAAALLAAVSAVAGSGPGLGCGYDWQQGICRYAQVEFSFSDGCNTVTCDGRGEYITTLMACPPANTEVEKRQCKNIQEEVAKRAEAELKVTCPMLSISEVCTVAARGFTYSDGCNTIACDGAGNGLSTLMFCPEPVKPVEFAACDWRVRKLLERLGARTCSGINSTAVCRAEGVGFRFSDGCNTVECTPDGGFVTTLMDCPAAPEASVICRWARKQARVAATGRSGLPGQAAADRQFACPALAISRVCTAEVVGFRYNDGCNDVHCVSAGNAVSTFKLCEPARPDKPEEVAAEAAYCERAATQMQRRKAESSRHYQCLTATEVCLRDGERKSYFDGCNYCFCIGVGRAGCTRRACRPYFSTRAEFQEECVRRKAGIIN